MGAACVRECSTPLTVTELPTSTKHPITVPGGTLMAGDVHMPPPAAVIGTEAQGSWVTSLNTMSLDHVHHTRANSVQAIAFAVTTKVFVFNRAVVSRMSG